MQTIIIISEITTFEGIILKKYISAEYNCLPNKFSKIIVSFLSGLVEMILIGHSINSSNLLIYLIAFSGSLSNLSIFNSMLSFSGPLGPLGALGLWALWALWSLWPFGSSGPFGPFRPFEPFWTLWDQEGEIVADE